MRRGGWIRLAYLAAAFVALRLAIGVAGPFVVALALAAVLEPAVQHVGEVTGWSRPVSAGAVLGALVAAVALVGVYLAVHLLPEVAALHGLAPGLAAGARRAITAAALALGAPPGWPAALSAAVAQQAGTVTSVVSRGALVAAGTLAAVPGIALGAGMSVFGAYLILLDGPLGLRVRALAGAVPGGTQAVAVLAVAARAAWRLASTELLLASLTAVASTAAFWLLGARVPIVLGLCAGLLDLIPYAGPAVILAPWGVALLLTGHPGRALAVACAWLCLAGVRGILELRWVGRRIGLSTLWVLVSFYLGARLLGFAGFLLGPVLAAAVWAVWRDGGSDEAAAGAGAAGRRRPARVRMWTMRLPGTARGWGR